MSTEARPVTRLLSAISSGDGGAAEELLPVVYEELRALAQAQMAAENPGLTLQPTALVHEAYLRLVGDEDVRWQNRAHFFGAAARAMRRILVERARRVRRERHGGGRRRVPLDAINAAAPDDPDVLVELDGALDALESLDPRLSEVVMLRHFAGLSVDETSSALGVSPRTVKRDWQIARAWLYKHISESADA